MKDTSDAEKLLSELSPPLEGVDAELCHRATLIFRYNSFGHTSATLRAGREVVLGLILVITSP